jgi:peptidoglycan L-alanyl-D-glutamate endopeptidase CwlK
MDVTKLNSRDIQHLHPDLVAAWQWADSEWDKRYPGRANPVLTQTFRSEAVQNAFFAQGRETLESVNAKRLAVGLAPIKDPQNRRITNARGGKSKHNVYPSKAFDIAFIEGKNTIWTGKLFEDFYSIVKEKYPNVIWGGNFVSIKDAPHFEI